MCRRFSITDTASRLRESFLRKAGFIEVEAGTCQTGSWARGWLDSGDEFLAIALLHSRCRFIGEMIAQLQITQDNRGSSLHRNSTYDWCRDTKTQLSNDGGGCNRLDTFVRRLSGRLAATPAGLEAISRLEIFSVETDRRSTKMFFQVSPRAITR